MLGKVVLYISLTTIPLLITYYVKNHYKKLKKTNTSSNDSDYYYHTLFITTRNKECKLHIFNETECGDYCSYKYIQTILNFISSSKTSISMCMYTLTLRAIHDELAKAHNRGVIVRVITDPVMIEMKPAKFRRLKTFCDIDVKISPHSNSLMHHKFCLVDEKDSVAAKMFMGSLNLTLQGFTSNFDFVVFTNNNQWIQRYSEEFEELWQDFKSY